MKVIQVLLDVRVVKGVEVLVGSTRGHVKCDLKCQLMRVKSPVKLQLDTEQNYLHFSQKHLFKTLPAFLCLFHVLISHNSKF